MRSEREQILLLQQGEEKAFEEVFSRYFYGFYRFATCIKRDHQAADEVVDDVFCISGPIHNLPDLFTRKLQFI